MLKIIWRNPNQLDPPGLSLVKVFSYDSETGQPRVTYRTDAEPDGAEVVCEIVANRNEPLDAA